MKSTSIFYKQHFGVEIELTGITRYDAAKVIADFFGTETVGRLHDGCYDTHTAIDRAGRTWKCSRDGSISCTHNGALASDIYSCEVVTPILNYSDIDDLQEIVRTLRSKGAVANSSCGIHVHVDGANHDVYSLTRLLNLMLKRQNLIYEALDISATRESAWCCKTQAPIVRAFRACAVDGMSFEQVWYSSSNDARGVPYHGGVDHRHYNPTRYHGLNLHAFFTKGTVEFRLFNGTTHAGKIKAYIQFCLALSAYAIGDCEENHRFLTARFERTDTLTKEEKRAAMLNFLEKRIGMTGKEFSTARLHLTSVFTGAEVA